MGLFIGMPARLDRRSQVGGDSGSLLSGLLGYVILRFAPPAADGFQADPKLTAKSQGCRYR
jgi:hypothetical protein